MSGGESLERLARLGVAMRLRAGAGDRLQCGVFLVVERHQREAPRSPVIHQPVMGDGVQPCGELRLRRIARARFDDAHPHVLEDLVGFAPGFHRAQHEAEEPSLVASIKRLERPGIAASICKHELFVRRHRPRF